MIQKLSLVVIILIIAFFLVLINMYTEPEYQIYDIHEHVDGGNMDKLLFAMRENNISFTAVLGSPQYTLTLRNPGFEKHEKNNNFLLNTSKNNSNIGVFCTIDPRKETAIETLKNCIEKGALGLKLYSGHYSSFYNLLGPLDREEMLSIYKYCEENKIPIILHSNIYYQSVREELERILTNYPNIVIDCPHWCTSSTNTKKFRYIYDSYPNLYTDISFGSRFAEEGFERISKEPEKYRKLVEDYQDRFMFGTDMVLTNTKSKEFARDMIACYRKMLEEDKYECSVGKKGSKFSVYGNFTGLNLDPDILRKIYWENPRKFIEAKF